MTTRRELAVKMLAAGRRYRDVAGVTGLAVNTVASYARLALRDGTLVRRSRNAASLLAGLPADVRDWLAAETPPGATVEQVVIAIILDAYAEDTAADMPRKELNAPPRFHRVPDRQLPGVTR